MKISPRTLQYLFSATIQAAGFTYLLFHDWEISLCIFLIIWGNNIPVNLGNKDAAG